MLDDDHRMPRRHQRIQLFEQAIDVPWMQAGSRLIEYIQGRPTLVALQFGGQFDPLGLATRQFGRRLAEAQIAQADIAQDLQRAANPRLPGEHLDRFVHRQLQHLGDIQTLPSDRQGLGVVARTVAGRARRVDAGHEQQFDADKAFAFAGRTSSLGHVERKLAGVIAVVPGLGRGGVELAHVVEQPGVGRQVRTRGAADGFLIDLHQTLDRRQATGDLAAADLWRIVLQAQLFSLAVTGGAPQMCAHQLQQRLTDQARFAGPRYTGHRRETAQRKLGAEVVQVIAGDAFQPQPVGRLAADPGLGDLLGEQVGASLGVSDVGQPCGGPL